MTDAPDPTHSQPITAAPRSKLALWVPLGAVVIMLVFLGAALRSGDPSQLPSALIGKPVPEFNLPPLADASPSGLSSAMLRQGKPVLLNVWASWCAPCQIEHPVLVGLAQKGVPIYSINYKDKPEAARRVLAQLGNPYRAIGADTDGFTAIDFGVTGVPETFLIDGAGRILYRHQGPLTQDVIATKIMPALEHGK